MPNILTTSPDSSLALSAGMGQHASSKASPKVCELDEAAPLTVQHVLNITGMLKGVEEQLLNSCESAKTICDSEDVVNEILQAEQKCTVSTDSAGEEAVQRPDSLKGIQSFQRSHSNLASLGLAFPAQNNSVSHWPTMTDRTTPHDAESYTYSPGYDQIHSKDSDR